MPNNQIRKRGIIAVSCLAFAVSAVFARVEDSTDIDAGSAADTGSLIGDTFVGFYESEGTAYIEENGTDSFGWEIDPETDSGSTTIVLTPGGIGVEYTLDFSLSYFVTGYEFDKGWIADTFRVDFGVLGVSTLAQSNPRTWSNFNAASVTVWNFGE